MKRFFTIVLILVNLFFFSKNILAQTANKSINKSRSDYEKFVNQHPYSNHQHFSKNELKKIPKKDRPDLAWQQNFLMILDPALGYVPDKRLLQAYRYTDSLLALQRPLRGAIPGITWQERGPDNVGGRTRALMFDPNDVTHKKVWAGGVTGGLWYNNDISSSTSSWIKVNDFWDNISITCIAYDPNDSQTFYVGTGEGFTAYSTTTTRGAGVWKTTNGGSNWTQISSTLNYFYINDISVRDESGTSVLYVAVDVRYYQGKWHGSQNGLYRSTNGGSTFTQVLPKISGYPYAPADIEIAADNRIFIGTRKNPYGKGGGVILYSDNGTTWTAVNNYSSISGVSRVEIACAPSNANYLYALIEADGKLAKLTMSSNKGANWTEVNEPIDADPGIPNTDFTRNQAWYDLILAVDPNDFNTVVAGGIDLHKTTNGGTTWTQISHWWGGYGKPYVHADHHALVFSPSSSSILINGNDGGVAYSSDINLSSPSFDDRNKNYNVTQFYSCALNPQSASDNFIGGTQDNGTQKFTSSGINSTTEITGGDGCFSFIDQDAPNYQISSYVYNNYKLTTNNWSSYSQISTDGNTGSFVNVADYDDKENILYSARTNNSLQRILNVTSTPATPDTIVISLGSMASAIKASKYSSATTSTIFVGTAAGKLFKIENAQSTSPTVTEITGALFPNGNISSIDVGQNENEILVTFSNYGVNSVWETTNGGTTWDNKEGNLADMPIRWCIYYPDNTDWVMLATEVGVWSTNNLSVASPDWQPTNGGLSHVRSDMLQYRGSDKTFLVATHGRGMFTTSISSTSLIADFIADSVCFGDSVSFVDVSVSSNPIDSVCWDIDSNALFNDKKSNSFKYFFSKVDTFSIGMKVFSAGNTDSIYKKIIIYPVAVSGFTISDTIVCPGDTIQLTNSTTISSGNTLNYKWSFGDGNIATAKDTEHFYTFLKTYNVKLVATSINGCKDSITKNVKVTSNLVANFTINDSVQCFKNNSFVFADASYSCASIDSIIWDTDNDAMFDDTSGSSFIFVFSTTGTFKIGMKVFASGDSDQLYRNVYVYPNPITDFSVNTLIQPLFSNNFVFTNNSNVSSPDILTYLWDFDDGNTSTAKDTNYSYSSAGNYDVLLIATTNNACVDSAVKNVQVYSTNLVANYIADTVCFGDSTSFIENSYSSMNILSYKWAFDNDSIFNDAIGDTSFKHYFDSAGVYTIGLEVRTANDTSKIFKKVVVGAIPVAGFTVNNNTQPLPSNNFVFTNASTLKYGILNYQWEFGDNDTALSKNPTHSYSSVGNYTVKLFAISDLGCIDSATATMIVNPGGMSVNAAFTANNTCFGDSTKLEYNSTVTSDKITNVMWDYGDGNNSIIKKDHKHYYTSVGNYNIVLIVLTKAGLTDTASQSIDVFPSPKINLIFDGDTILYKGQSVNVSVSNLFDSLLWSTGETSQIIEISDEGIYSVRVVNSNNCDDETSFKVTVKTVKRFKAVDVFTPNGDGINDRWIIEDIDAYKPCKLTIYNRYGDVLYSTNDYKNDWNGKYDGELLREGAYYYILETNDDRIIKGSISIVY
ncbi:MAG: PKD domain-containing protein [Bacteroidota bacterium]|nr:PKD domain-containing protein [Bacteroidota bacterium]